MDSQLLFEWREVAGLVKLTASNGVCAAESSTSELSTGV